MEWIYSNLVAQNIVVVRIEIYCVNEIAISDQACCEENSNLSSVDCSMVGQHDLVVLAYGQSGGSVRRVDIRERRSEPDGISETSADERVTVGVQSSPNRGICF